VNVFMQRLSQRQFVQRTLAGPAHHPGFHNDWGQLDWYERASMGERGCPTNSPRPKNLRGPRSLPRRL
jgi:hypothetical protein